MIELFGNGWFLFFATVIIALAMITLALAVGLLADAWRNIRVEEKTIALKQEMLARGLSVREMERLLRPVPGPNVERPPESPIAEAPLNDGQLVQKLMHRLAGESASESAIEAILKAFVAADPSGKLLIYYAIFGLTDRFDASDEQILAVLNGLRGSGVKEDPIQRDQEPNLAFRASAIHETDRVAANRAEEADTARGLPHF